MNRSSFGGAGNKSFQTPSPPPAARTKGFGSAAASSASRTRGVKVSAGGRGGGMTSSARSTPSKGNASFASVAASGGAGDGAVGGAGEGGIRAGSSSSSSVAHANTNVTASSFTKRQLQEIEDVFTLFNFHTHNGLMRGDDLGIALRVLGLEISKDQHKGYVALYSTSATNIREHEAQHQQQVGGGGGGQSPTSASSPNATNASAKAMLASGQALISKMANLKASQNYFTLSDFVEICEDAKDAKIRAGGTVNGSLRGMGGGGGYGSDDLTTTDEDRRHTKQWIVESFAAFDEASVSAASLQKSLQKVFDSIQAQTLAAQQREKQYGSGGSESDGGGSDAEGGGYQRGLRGVQSNRRSSACTAMSGQSGKSSQKGRHHRSANNDDDDPSHIFEDDYANPELNGVLSVDVPTMEEVAAAFRDLGLDANLGMTCEDLLRVLGDTTTIL